MIPALFFAAFLAAQEGDGYVVDYLTPPDGAVLEVGGMDFLPDGRLAVSTRRGQVWLVDDPLAKDPTEARFTLFAEGLWEGLGLSVREGVIHVLQRGEVSRLIDVDGDDRCDVVARVTDDWGLSGNYHEFAYGLPFDEEGNSYVTLNVSFFSPKWWHGKSPVPYRGWALRVARNGAVTPIASGFRSPCGVSLSPAGELFVTDNQGDWMPASPIFRVIEGGFYGHPASLDWTEEYLASRTKASDTVPPERAASDRLPAAVWLPYKWSRSPGNMAWDTTAGAFGPFGGQVFVSELTNGMVLRGDFEELEGVLQGWVTPFRRDVGSVVRLLFAPDGTLLCGFTNRGWGGLPPADGLGRIRWTGTVPFEIAEVNLLGRSDVQRDGGFRLRFTRPVAEDWLAAARRDPSASVLATQYCYDYWWEYGSPERETKTLAVSSLEGHEDVLELRLSGLEPGHVARLRLFGLKDASGAPLVQDELAYTVNVLPGAAPGPPVARIVPPPPARESDEEGWLRLTYGDATDGWEQEGWELVAAERHPDDPARFRVGPGNSHLTNTASENPSAFVSKAVFGDGSIHADFTLPEGGRTTLWVMGAYGILLRDTETGPAPTAEDCGAILGGAGFAGVPPSLNGYSGAHLLHELDVVFRAPRFDARGRKVENARLVRVRMDDVLLHENLELPGPSAGAPSPVESSLGPLVFTSEGTQVALGNVKVKPTPRAERAWDPSEDGFVPLLDLESDDPLVGWRITEEGYWSIEDDVLVGEGPRSHLYSPRGDYRDFELLLEAKISDGGKSGVHLRAPFVPEGWVEAYEATINSSFADARKTGSLIGLADAKPHLIAPDTWFEYRILCRDEGEAGTRVMLRVNGVVITDHLDASGRFGAGHIALQQHHDGSIVEFRKLSIREP